MENHGQDTSGRMVGSGKKAGPLRRLYDWVLHWAETPFGSIALFVNAFAESSFFPIPPDPLLMALSIGKQKKALTFALYCTLASVMGGIFGYWIGHSLWNVLEQPFYKYVPSVSPESFDKMRIAYDKYNFWVVFAAGFTPIPYKVITIGAGVFNINFFIFVLASAVGRAGRFFLVAGMIRLFGEPIKSFIDKYFNLLSILFVILLVGGFLVIKYAVH